jgi:hypothetical protein
VSRRWGLLALLALYLLVGHLLLAPASVSAAGQRITAIFLATILGLMIQPLPGAAVVMLGVTMLVIAGGLPLKDALSGYSSASAWLVLGASYALVFSDVTLAGGIPSITASASRGGNYLASGRAPRTTTGRESVGFISVVADSSVR